MIAIAIAAMIAMRPRPPISISRNRTPRASANPAARVASDELRTALRKPAAYALLTEFHSPSDTRMALRGLAATGNSRSVRCAAIAVGMSLVKKFRYCSSRLAAAWFHSSQCWTMSWLTSLLSAAG